MIWTTRPRSRIANISAIIAGSGQPIVLVHGVGLRAEAWNRQLDCMSQHYLTIAVDMPGHGESPLLEEPAKLADYTNAIAEALDRSALGQPALVIGHSMGAMIALDMALRFPPLVSGVVALNTVFERSEAQSKAVKARAASLDGKSVADPEMTLKRWFANDLSCERRACSEWLCSVDPVGYRSAYRIFACENGPSRSTLAAMDCPALFITGAEEPNSTPAMSRKMAELAPHGQAMIVDEAAHMMPMTHADEINGALMNFAGALYHEGY